MSSDEGEVLAYPHWVQGKQVEGTTKYQLLKKTIVVNLLHISLALHLHLCRFVPKEAWEGNAKLSINFCPSGARGLMNSSVPPETTLIPSQSIPFVPREYYPILLPEKRDICE